MHEGRNIHYSQVDSKLLCSYSLKVCKQRRLNGYAFCNRHILEDPTAPFKRCVHISNRGKARCSNPIPQDRNTDLCNIHQQKVNATKEKELQQQISKSITATMSPPPPSYPGNPNGLLHHHTPPTTPTQDPQRLFIMDRLKNKFTRVQSCPSEDVIVNVVDDSDDPYAFPDNDSEPVKTSSSQSEPVESSQNSQGNSSSVGGMCHHAAVTSVTSSRSSLVTMVSSPLAMNIGLVSSLLQNNVVEVAETSAMLPPTPPTGGTPIAKLYPELAGKLHGSPVAEKPSSISGKGKTTSLTGKIPSTSSLDKVTNSNSSSGNRGKNSSTALQSSKAKSPSSHSSHSSRTMNKLQTKIAQNRIKDKQKSKLKRESEEGLSLASGSDAALSVMPLGPPSATSNTADTTSTIFSLGSIPSLGNLLSQDRSQAASNASSSAFPVTAASSSLPIVDHVTNTNLHHVISSSPSPTVATVIPATVFMPFPNLACALSSLSNKAHQQQHTQHNKGKVKQVANSKTKSGSSGNKKKSERAKQQNSKGSVKKKGKTNSRRNYNKSDKSAIMDNSDLFGWKECMHLGATIASAGKGLKTYRKESKAAKGLDFAERGKTNVRNSSATSISSQIKENSCHKLALSHKRPRPCNLDLPKLHTVTDLLNQAESIKKKKERRISASNEDLKVKPESLYTSQNTLHHLEEKQHIVDKNVHTVTSPLKELGQGSGGIGESLNSAVIKVENIKTEPLDAFQESFTSGVSAVGHGHTAEVKVKSQKVKVSLSSVENDRKHILKVRQGSSSVIRQRRLWKKANILSEFEARKMFRRKSSVAAYRHHTRRVKEQMPLLRFGVCSSSDEDSPQPLYSSWDHSCLEEEDQTCDNNDLLDTQFLSTIRSTKISLVKSKFRRQLSHSRKLSHVASMYHSQNEATLDLIRAARKDAKAASAVVLAMSGELNKVRKTRKSEENSQPRRTCLVACTETGKVCSKKALPYTNHCPEHIMYNVDQQLFDYCTAKFSNNTQCCRPVVDVTHELPLCTEHARKADNYQKSLKQPKKPRKKTKPSALTRPPKKGKKRKNQQKRQVTTGGNSGNGIFADLESLVSVKDEETDDMCEARAEMCSAPADAGDDVIPEISTEVKVKEEQDDYAELETFSPDTLDKTLELPLDMLEATKFLDKHDFGDMLTKLPDYAFDLFSATETAKPNDLTPTKEETELLEAAIAEASSSQFNFPTQPPPDLPQLGSNTTKTGLDGLCLPVSITKETLDKLAIEKISQEPPLDYMSDDNEAKEDELTKQIASSLMQRHLSDEEDVMDTDNINNLASSLTASDLNCISKALSGSDLEMNLTNLSEGNGMLGIQQGSVAVMEQGHPATQQFPPQGLVAPTIPPPPAGLHNNTNNNQGQQSVVDQRTAKEEGEIGGQLAQILETFRNDQGTVDRLQQNIRQFLSNESPTSSVLPNHSSPGSTSHLPQQTVGASEPSILQEFLTLGKQHTASRVESPGCIPQMESFPALLRQSSNDSSYSSGSGAANGIHRSFKHEPGQVTLMGSTSVPSVSNMNDAPPNVSVTEIPPNVSVTDIPFTCQAKGPPNVTVTAIPASFQASSSAWPPSISSSSAIDIPSFSSIQAQLNMITSQLVAANNANMNLSEASPQKPNPPKRTQSRQKSPRSTKKAKRSHMPQLTLDIAAANVCNRQSGSSASASALADLSGVQTNIGTGLSQQQPKSLPQFVAQPVEETMTAMAPITFTRQLTNNKVPATPPVQMFHPQQHTVPSSPQILTQSQVVERTESHSKGVPRFQVTSVANSRQETGKISLKQTSQAVTTTVLSPLPQAVIQTNILNVPSKTPVNQVKTSPIIVKESLTKSQMLDPAGSPGQASVVGRVPGLGNQPSVLNPSLASSSLVPSAVDPNKPTPPVVTCFSGKPDPGDVLHQVSWPMSFAPQQQQQSPSFTTCFTNITSSSSSNIQKGNFTVSTSTQAFLASLLQDTSAKKQQVTPEQQKMLQQLQQSAISAIPAVPSQNLHPRQPQHAMPSLSGGNTAGNNVMPSASSAKISLQHLLQGQATSVTRGQMSNLQNASPVSKDSSNSSSPQNIVISQDKGLNSGNSPALLASPIPPNVLQQNTSLPKYSMGQTSKSSQVYFHGTTLPPSRSSPRQQPPLPRSSQGQSPRPALNRALSPGHAKPTLMATSMQSVRIPMNTDQQKNICMLNPLLSNMIQQASINTANLQQKTSQAQLSSVLSTPNGSVPILTSDRQSDTLNSAQSGLMSLMTTVGSNPVVVQGSSNILSLPGVLTGTTQNPTKITVNPVNPLQKSHSPVKILSNDTTSHLISTPVLSQPALGLRPQIGSLGSQTTGFYQVPANSLIQSPVKSQLMPNLPPPLVSTTISGQKILRQSSELLSSLKSSFGQLPPSLIVSHNVARATVSNDYSAIMQTTTNSTPSLSTSSLVQIGTFPMKMSQACSSRSVTSLTSGILSNTPIVSPVVGSSTVRMTGIPSTVTTTTTANSVGVTGCFTSSAVLPSGLTQAKSNSMVTTQPNTALPTIATLSELPPRFMENISALPPNALPQIAAALQQAQATLTSGGGGAGIGLKLTYPLALPSGLLCGLTNQATTSGQLLPQQPLPRQPFPTVQQQQQLPSTTSGSQGVKQDLGADKA